MRSGIRNCQASFRQLIRQLIRQLKNIVPMCAGRKLRSGYSCWARLLPASFSLHAVRRFHKLSPDPDNAFFTDGVQDEILTDLAKIADLKVISRTSVLQYKSGV